MHTCIHTYQSPQALEGSSEFATALQVMPKAELRPRSPAKPPAPPGPPPSQAQQPAQPPKTVPPPARTTTAGVPAPKAQPSIPKAGVPAPKLPPPVPAPKVPPSKPRPMVPKEPPKAKAASSGGSSGPSLSWMAANSI